jgi:hypothetical protein
MIWLEGLVRMFSRSPTYLLHSPLYPPEILIFVPSFMVIPKLQSMVFNPPSSFLATLHVQSAHTYARASPHPQVSPSRGVVAPSLDISSGLDRLSTIEDLTRCTEKGLRITTRGAGFHARKPTDTNIPVDRTSISILQSARKVEIPDVSPKSISPRPKKSMPAFPSSSCPTETGGSGGQALI